MAKTTSKRAREEAAIAGAPLIEDVPLPPLDGDDPNAELKPQDYAQYGGAMDRASALANHYSGQKASAHARGDGKTLPWNVNGATKYERAVHMYGTQGDLKVNITQETPSGPMPRGMLRCNDVPSFMDFYNHVVEKWWDGNMADFSWEVMCGPRWVCNDKIHFAPDVERRLIVQNRLEQWKRSLTGQTPPGGALPPEPPPQPPSPPQQAPPYGGGNGAPPYGYPYGGPPPYAQPPPQAPPQPSMDPAVARELSELRRIVAESAMREELRGQYQQQPPEREREERPPAPRGETPLPAPVIAPYVPVAPPVSQYPYPSAQAPSHMPSPSFGFGVGGYGAPPPYGYPQPPYGYGAPSPFAPPPPPPAPPPPPPPQQAAPPPQPPPTSPFDDPRAAMDPINKAVKLLDGVKQAAKYSGMVEKSELDDLRARMESLQNGTAAAAQTAAFAVPPDPNAPKMPHIMDLGGGAKMVYDSEGNPLPPFNLTTVMANAPFIADAFSKAVGHFKDVMSTRTAAMEKAVELEERLARAKMMQSGNAPQQLLAHDPYVSAREEAYRRQQQAPPQAAYQSPQAYQPQYAPPQQQYAPPQPQYAPPPQPQYAQQPHAPPQPQYAPPPQAAYAPPPQATEDDPYGSVMPTHVAAPPRPVHVAARPAPPPEPDPYASAPQGSQPGPGQVDSLDDAPALYDESQLL